MLVIALGYYVVRFCHPKNSHSRLGLPRHLWPGRTTFGFEVKGWGEGAGVPALGEDRFQSSVSNVRHFQGNSMMLLHGSHHFPLWMGALCLHGGRAVAAAAALAVAVGVGAGGGVAGSSGGTWYWRRREQGSGGSETTRQRIAVEKPSTLLA